MKKILIILLLAMSVALNATVYYVQPKSENANASDSNVGTNINYPWETWGKAFTSASVVAGDTVYFRGGVYYSAAGKGGYTLSKSGTITDTLYMLNYPNEKPILDCRGQPIISSNYSIGVSIRNNSYLRVRGLTIRNALQYDGDDEATGLALERTSNSVIENCTVYNTHGRGFYCYENYELYIINCDSYDNCDSLTTVPPSNPLPGNDGYGFTVSESLVTSTIYFKNCRAWGNGDDGFATGSIGYCEYDNCWAFRNGKLEGNGQGYKMGWIYTTTAPLNRLYKNCIAAFNRVHGWTTNDQDYGVGVLNVYNNTSYHNGYQGWYNPVYGFYIENTNDDDQATETARRIFKNNIAYANEGAQAYAMSGAGWTNTYNSWNTPPGVTLSDANFISVDSTGITAARQADGSLPDNDCYNYFLKLAPTSDLIDAGMDVGLPYNGTAPDLGAFEYIVSQIKNVFRLGLQIMHGNKVVYRIVDN